MLKDFPVTVTGFSESGYQEWLTTQKVKTADLENANDSFLRMRGEHANRVHLNSGWFQAATRQMATNAKNTVVRNFAKRLRTYVIDHYELSRKDAHEVLNMVFAVEEFDPTYFHVIDPIIVELREKIPRVTSGMISWTPHDLLPMFHEFLSDIEKYNIDNKEKPKFVEKRVFCLLPTKQGFEANYCKVDSTGLRSLLKRSPDVSRDLWNPESGSHMTGIGGRWGKA
ncbi:hypothetical protein P3T76_008590 [Phytophthora citrophthora]|uniref:Uncharacterized protein n=1 Tax=Phytophthora citrophthora TaxID=4793 RepID=A0AAD9GIN8_9STRA|nr:hypothetical protein P3T76_008590 [Phytophthora citrophthora]